MLAFAMAAMTAPAQTVLWDGEDASITSRNANAGWWDRGNPVLVDNPEKDGINTSNKCLKFTMTDASKQVACPFRDWLPYPSLNLNGNRRLSFMIMKSKINENDKPTFNSNVLVELSDPTNSDAEKDKYWQKVAAWYDGDGKWQKVVLDFSTNGGLNDFPGVMTITANTDAVAVDHYVYIDNIVVEPIPMVGGTPLENVTNGTLEGAITVTGSYMKGECQNANGDWYPVPYDDFATLKNKVAAGITSIDMKTAIVKNVYNSIDDKNPNALIYTTKSSEDDIAEDDIANVVVNGTCATLNLNAGCAFNAPSGFTVTGSVNIFRTTRAGINSFCLPVEVSEGDLMFKDADPDPLANYLATYKETGTNVVFTKHATVAANTPFILDSKYAVTETNLNSDHYYITINCSANNKTVVATPNSLGAGFVGVYVPLGAGEVTDKWGIADSGKLQPGSSTATIKAFHAYLSGEVGARASMISFDDEDVTGINEIERMRNVENEKFYNLNGQQVAQPTRGLYIVNGKKVVIK